MENRLPHVTIISEITLWEGQKALLYSNVKKFTKDL